MATDIHMELGKPRAFEQVVQVILEEGASEGFALADDRREAFLVIFQDEREAFYIAAPERLREIAPPFSVHFRFDCDLEPEDDVHFDVAHLFCSIPCTKEFQAESISLSLQGSEGMPGSDEPSTPQEQRIHTYLWRLHRLLGATSTRGEQSVSGYVDWTINANGELLWSS